MRFPWFAFRQYYLHQAGPRRRGHVSEPSFRDTVRTAVGVELFVLSVFCVLAFCGDVAWGPREALVRSAISALVAAATGLVGFLMATWPDSAPAPDLERR
ncbi:MAG: hypothetical protein U0821_27710 [Chloroflexota bacterium]